MEGGRERERGRERKRETERKREGREGERERGRETEMFPGGLNAGGWTESLSPALKSTPDQVLCDYSL